MSGMPTLPEGCIAAVISFTTPRDACRLACVSTTFRSATDSDVVWDRFLSPEYLSAISYPGSVSGSSSSSTWSALSKKELYFRSCHNPIQKGKMSFWFDLPSGKKCYMISARELYLEDGDIIFAWYWLSMSEYNELGIACRFPEAAKRVKMNPFEIGGKISTSLMSPMTIYVAYLVFAKNWMSNLYGWPVEVVVGLTGSNNSQNRTIYFHRKHQDGDDDGFFLKRRRDWWVESELGEFYNTGDEDGELSITIKTTMNEQILIQGIEIRPKKE